MKPTKRTYTVSIKASKNYQSVSLTEGFEVDVDEKFNELDFDVEKQKLKDKLVSEANDFINSFVEEREISDSIDNLEL